jgi:hypothetical protein
MGTIFEDVKTSSEWIAKALLSSGYNIDFSPSSLWEIDRFFDEHTQSGTPISGGLLSEDMGSRLFAIGSYIGEVVIRSKGGEWIGDDSDPQVEMNIELLLSDDVRCWPVQRAMKRMKNGSEDGIAVYGDALGLDVGQRPEQKQKNPWWRFGK